MSNESTTQDKKSNEKPKPRPPVEVYCGDYRCRRCNMPMAWSSVSTMKCNTLGCMNQGREVEIPIIACKDAKR